MTKLHVQFHRSLTPAEFDADGALSEALAIRDDDRESVIRERLAAYESQSRPLIEFFREKGRRLFEIDASDQTPEALLFQVCRTINSPG